MGGFGQDIFGSSWDDYRASVNPYPANVEIMVSS